ncbi:MAG: carboxypeptidase M32 [Magnetovibrionaceae bacterium]
MGQHYQGLEARFRRLSLLGEAGSILHWDMATQLPEGAMASRAEQLAELRAISHGLLVAEETYALLEGAFAEDDLDPWQQKNRDLIEKRFAVARAMSEDLVTRESLADSACEAVWREARPEADFAKVLPKLRDVLAIKKEVGALRAEVLNLGLYDALLDQYEPDGRSKDIDPVFEDLAAWLPGFLEKVLAAQEAAPAIQMPDGPFAIETQREVAMRFMADLGFDFAHGRLDVSLHPFCGGTPDDVRITTRYDEEDFTSALMGVLHETGHALYERGLPKAYHHQPVGSALGMSIHESQSLLVEMQVCRGPAFLAYAAPILRETFGGSGPAWELENLNRLYTRVKQDFIRVDADEVTYPAHVILRYRLEKALLEDRMDLGDLPEAWNDGLEELLGIRPPDDRLGCLQDIHWYDGAWGYFPTYTLGAMTAAQFYNAAEAAHPEIPAEIEDGRFGTLMGWLAENVHGKGSSMTSAQLIEQATGKALSAAPFKAHLESRYLPG